MKIYFVQRDVMPEKLAAEAELVFVDGDLAGLKLVGFSIWKGNANDFYVTFPSRAFGVGPERKYFDFLRSSDGVFPSEAITKLKQRIITEFCGEFGHPLPTPKQDKQAKPESKIQSEPAKAKRKAAPRKPRQGSGEEF